MKESIMLRSQDLLIKKLPFKPYRSTVERLFRRFMPLPNQPQTLLVKTPWGEMLTAQAGDYLISEFNAPDDTWPVADDIFHDTYLITGPGRCTKKALTYLVPLTMVTDGDSDRQVSVETLEGMITVRAGDFYLAKGVKGEIWPMPVEKVGAMLVPLET